MKKTNNPFISMYPSIDLHGLDRITAEIKVKEFIYDCYNLEYYDIIVIHGKGSGVLKKSVHEYLSKEKLVLSYKTDNFNDGITIINLKRRNGYEE